MTTIQTWNFTMEEFTKHLNIGKDVLTNDLLTAGVINKEQAKQIHEDFAIMLVKRGMFGAAVDKILNWTDEHKKDAVIVKTIKLNLNNNRDNNNDNKSDESDREGMDNGS